MRCAAVAGTLVALLIRGTAAGATDRFADEGAFHPTLRLTETIKTEGAYRVGGDPDISKARVTAWLSGALKLTPKITLRAAGRVWYDGIYETDEYNEQVRHEFRYDLAQRDALADVAVTDRLDVRVGRQTIVWGDAVALFFADVFNPKDLRESITWDLADQEIPLLAIDAAYRLQPDLRWEVAASPEVARDKFAPSGADFAFRAFEAPQGIQVTQAPRDESTFDLDHGRAGTRVTAYKFGLEGSIFYLAGREESPTFRRTIVGPAEIHLTPVEPFLHRAAGTLAYATRDWVFRAEAIGTFGKQFRTDAPADSNGLLAGREVDYVLSATGRVVEWDVNLQFFEIYRLVGKGEPFDPTHETGGSLLIQRGLWNERIEPSLLVVSALDRASAWVRPAVIWRINDTWSAWIGADVFLGRGDTFFGQFDHASRVTLGIAASFSQLVAPGW